MYEDLNESFKEYLSLENVNYYYHVTNQDPNLILEEGLLMVGSKIYQTAIEVPEEFKDDPYNYISGEKGKFYRENASIILIAIKNDELNLLIRPIDFYPTNWTHDEEPNYYIDKKYILGYIDSNNYDFFINENFDLLNELYMKR